MPESDDIPIGERRLVVRPRLFAILRELAYERETTPTDEMNRAVREMLEREGRWPPKPTEGEK